MTTKPPTALLDVNVLLALSLSSHVHHNAAHAALEGHAGRWATCPMTEAGFVRLMMTPAVTQLDFTGTQTLRALESMRRHPAWCWLADDVSILDHDTDRRVLTSRQQVTDLHLVGLAARHGAKLWTFDASLTRVLAEADRRHVHLIRD